MPKIMALRCNGCNFTLNLSWGYEFVINDAGKRLVLPKYEFIHDYAVEVLCSDGHDPSKLSVPKGWLPRYMNLSSNYGTSITHNEFLESRIGSYTTMVCKSCLKVFFIDKEKDPISCTNCESKEVIEINEHIAELACLKCSDGMMLKHGRTILA